MCWNGYTDTLPTKRNSPAIVAPSQPPRKTPNPNCQEAMSARLLRKVLQEQEQQLRSSDHDAEVEADEGSESPSPSAAPSRNPFDLLDDDQDGEPEVDDAELLEEVVEQSSAVKKSSDSISCSNHKSKKNKKKKKKKDSTSTKKKDEKSLASILEDLSITSRNDDHQRGHENSRSMCTEVQLQARKQATPFVLTVDPKHLKAENELRKIFGSKVVNSFENNQGIGSSRQMRGGRRAFHNLRKTILFSPSSNWGQWDGSLSMELLETKGGIHYFRYAYSQSYSYVQEVFEAAKAAHDLNAIHNFLEHHPYHVEALLIFAEVFKFSGEHQASADKIGKCLFAFECAWHPLFNPMQGNCRLKYIHDINKPFFSALFSHMKNMDRRGCHRSALEVCKLLLSLDYDDPMGALFCIDYFSLRAQEFTWLEQFSEEYRSDNSLWLFPNFSYSLAVCRFYLERDAASKEEGVQTGKAASGDLIKQALMLHPLVLKKLVDKAPLKDPAWTQILKNSFFGSAQAGSPSLDHLISIYVERNYLIWRFPDLQNFLKEAALQVIESLKHNSTEAKDWACIRREAFSSEKNEYSHLLISDFSDAVQSVPPEELQQFMLGPQMVHDVQVVNREANPEGAQPLREVVGRNPAFVLLESILPWVNYGVDGNREQNDENQGDEE